jgi:hypothetical protein
MTCYLTMPIFGPCGLISAVLLGIDEPEHPTRELARTINRPLAACKAKKGSQLVNSPA